MTDFFHGWRRKAGGATLIMAWTLMIGWVRSEAVFDSFYAKLGEGNDFVVESKGGSLCFCWGESNKFAWWSSSPLFGIAMSDPADEWTAPLGRARWKWQCGGFDGLVYTDMVAIESFRVIWPYWSSVIPLTLLSAYLILWPGKRTKPRPPQS